MFNSFIRKIADPKTLGSVTALSYAEDMVAYLDLSNWHSFTYCRSRRVDERRLGDRDLNIAIAKSKELKLSFSNSKKLFLSGNTTYSDMLTLIDAGFVLDGLPDVTRKWCSKSSVQLYTRLW